MNTKHRIASIVICSTILFALSTTALATGDSGDGEYWQTHSLKLKIDDDWTFGVSEEFRMGRSGSNPYLHNVDFSLAYSGLADWLDVSMNFKKEYERDSTGKFRGENRPHFNATLKGHVWDLALSNRSRLEYRNREHKEDLFRYRNKTTIKFPWKFTSLQLQPYVAEEFFINLGENNISQNRIFAGFGFKVCENLDMGVFYMFKQSKISGGWRDTNVIGTEFKLAF